MPERLERAAKFVVERWERRRSAMKGKAMVVNMSREKAMSRYDEIIRLRSHWDGNDDDSGSIKVITTEGMPQKHKSEKDDEYQNRISLLIASESAGLVRRCDAARAQAGGTIDGGGGIVQSKV